jgi:hypothetical protein
MMRRTQEGQAPGLWFAKRTWPCANSRPTCGAPRAARACARSTPAAAGALVYSQYAKSAGFVSLVPASGGASTTVASGWVSHAFFVEEGRRIAVVMPHGNAILEGAIDLVDPATATRTSLVADFRFDQDEFLFTPERLGYWIGSTSPLDLVIERLDLGDRFTVEDVNNIWQRSPDKRWLAVYTATGGLRTVGLETGAVHFVSSRPVNNFKHGWLYPHQLDTFAAHMVSCMLSRPIGFWPTPFVRSMTRVSIRSPAFGLVTVAKFPKVFGTVPDAENTLVEPISPVKTYGMGVMLEYRSMETKLKAAPPAVTLTCPLAAAPAGAKNKMDGAGFPKPVRACQPPAAARTVIPDSV